MGGSYSLQCLWVMPAQIPAGVLFTSEAGRYALGEFHTQERFCGLACTAAITRSVLAGWLCKCVSDDQTDGGF